MKIGVYPGSFDPITHGHLDIIKRAAVLVETLYVAVVANPNKNPLFSVEERSEMIRREIQGLPNVKVDSFHGLLVEYVKSKGARIIFKGLRAISDFESEFQMALVNRELEPSVDTLFLMTSPHYAFLSSSVIKQVISLGGEAKGMVSDFVARRMKEKQAQSGTPIKKVKSG